MNYDQATDITFELLAEHGLAVEWAVGLNDSRSNSGTCNYTRRTIYLSRFFIDIESDESTLNTIRHEVAHALAGPRAGHGPRWRAIFLELGGDGQTVNYLSDEAKAEFDARAKWRGVCPVNSEHVVYRNRLTQSIRTAACAKHGGKFSDDLVLNWERQA